MKKHLTHIEALRGLAILLVVLFHLAPDFCPSGFIGVDMFLLISGYLLVRGLLKNDSKDFSLLEFANKKLLRIFPPLLCMVVPMLIIGLWFIINPELKIAANTAYYSLLGYSNIYLTNATKGYFSFESQFNPFVHTWYLSVILQMYCIFALTTFALKPFSKTIKWGVFLILGLLSLGLVIYYKLIAPHLNPHEEVENIYYLTWCRVFEVVGGALVLLLPCIKYRFLRLLLPPVAMVLIIFFAFLDIESRFLVIPLTGLLLWGQMEKESSWLLDNAFFRFFGKYSFSFYIWHWPIIVYFNYSTESVEIWHKILIFVISIGLAVVTYYLAEKRKWKLWLIALIWGISMLITFVIRNNNSISQSIHPHIYEFFSAGETYESVELCTDYGSSVDSWDESDINQADTEGASSMNFLRLGDKSIKASFIMIGDSHAGAFSAGMAQIAHSLKISGYYIPVYVTPFYNRMCIREAFRFSEEKKNRLFDWLKRHPEIKNVVIVQRWSIRLTKRLNDEAMPVRYDGSEVPNSHCYQDAERALEKFCLNLKDIGKQAIIMTEVPPVAVNPASYVRRALLHGTSLNMDALTCPAAFYYNNFSSQLMTFSALEQKGVCKVLPIHRHLLMKGEFCAIKDNKVWMEDSNHISECGAVMYAREFYEVWRPYLCPNEETPQED